MLCLITYVILLRIHALLSSISSSTQVVTDYVSGGENSVMLLCNDSVLLGGCVQGTSSVLTRLPGCELSGGLLLASNSPYLIATIGSTDLSANSAALTQLLGEKKRKKFHCPM